MKSHPKAMLAKYAARGKSYLVLIRSTGDRLFMQQLYHSDEVRDIGEVPVETRRNSDDLAAIKSALARHDGRFDSYDQRFDGHDKRFDRLDH